MKRTFLMDNYAPLPLTFQRGEGVWLYDENGKRYLDFVAGIAVCGLGHAQPQLNAALTAQAQQLWHVSNNYHIAQQAQAAQTLCQLSAMDKAFFCNSGAEANEAAIKISRLHARRKNIDNPIVICFEKSFHGRTAAAMSATGNDKIKRAFTPLLQQFVHLPYNDCAALQRYQNNDDVVALLLECVQGEGGVNSIDSEFLQCAANLCKQNNWLLMIDEIQTGICRTGAWFNYQHYDVLPDVITLAKGLGNGIPVGACLARGDAARLFTVGQHGSTFGGTPLVMSVVNEALALYSQQQLAARSKEKGELLLNLLRQKLAGNAQVKEIRGLGLLLGIELQSANPEIVTQALQRGLLLNVTAEKVIRLTPPLIIDETHIAKAVEIIAQILL